jgi:acetylglutamate kinase
MTDERATWVIKVGGEELAPGPRLAEVCLWVAHAVRRGRSVIVVHGGGGEVTARAHSLGLPSERRAGQRVTSNEMLEVVVEVLAGRVNVRLVNALEGAGVPAIGISGVSAHLLPVVPAGEPAGSLGWVGRPIGAGGRLLHKLIEQGLTPVIAPIGSDGRGGVYNVNADLAAAAVAGSVGAELYLLTNVPAVRDGTGAPIPRLSVPAARALVRAGVATDGMIPKLRAAVRAVEGGSPHAWIGDLPSVTANLDFPTGGTILSAGRDLTAGPITLLPSLQSGGT